MATQTLKWTAYPATAVTYLGAELDALAVAGNKLGAALSASGNFYMDTVLYVATATSPRVAGDYVSLYTLPCVDNANYDYGSDTVDPGANNLIGTFTVTVGTSAIYTSLTKRLTPAGNFKMLVENKTMGTFAAAGNWLQYVFYSEKSE